MDLIDMPPGGKTPSPWTEARLRRLIGLWNDRLGAAGIARALGPGFSRSAVVGKLFRLGLRPTGEQRHEAQAAGARHSRARQRIGGVADGARPPALPEAPLPPPTPCAVTPLLVGLLDLRRSSCRWPYDVNGETRFCGHTVGGGGPYCEAHRAVAYLATLPPLTLEAIEAADRRRRLAGPTRTKP
jgi:GcrA cell cycle regulator